MYFLLDMWIDQWVRGILFLKFLPGFIVEAQSNLCNPQVYSEDNQSRAQD